MIHPLLGREEHVFQPPNVEGKRILVTGSNGSIGTGVCARLELLGAVVQRFDTDEGLDVTNIHLCEYILRNFKPNFVIHLAAHKYATTAETIPYEVANLNIHGTHYVCSRAADHGVQNVIVASTCKAIEPETVYGASKLIGERIALNLGYTVGRFFNVIDSAGNVFEIWRRCMLDSVPLPVTPCKRYFISGAEAVDFIVHLLAQRAGERYAPFPGDQISLVDMAARFSGDGYPIEEVAPRRGDRLVEPLHGERESYDLIAADLMLIRNAHDRSSDGPLERLSASPLPGSASAP